MTGKDLRIIKLSRKNYLYLKNMATITKKTIEKNANIMIDCFREDDDEVGQ